jgi:hypothetical protein
MNELCADGLDNDCDGFIDLQDADCCLDNDGDGYGTGPYCLGLDCDDADPEIPGAPCDGPDSDGCAEGFWECVGDTAQCTDTTGDSIEICNGIDDDCNGSTDDAPDLCDDGLTCTLNTCAAGNCIKDLIPGTCLIDNHCYAHGQANPVNACEYCDATSSPFDWRPRNCDDGDGCTVDSCDPTKGCRYVFVDCDDGLACTIDSCDSSSGTCTNQPICHGSVTFECPPTTPFGDPTYCDSSYYCSTTTGQCEVDDCCGP